MVAATSCSNKTPQPKIMLKITFKFLCIFILLGVVNLKADPDPRHGEITTNLQSDENNRSIATGFVTDGGTDNCAPCRQERKNNQILVDRQRVLTATLLKGSKERFSIASSGDNPIRLPYIPRECPLEWMLLQSDIHKSLFKD